MITDLQTHIDGITKLFDNNGIKPNTVKAKLVEHAYIVAMANTLGGVHKLPPAIAMCAMAGRSILTLATSTGYEPQ